MKTIIPILLAILLYPVQALAIHNDVNKTKCLDCHVTLPFDRADLSYTAQVGDVCRKCHKKFPCNDNNKQFAHPMDVKPTMSIPVDMPLDAEGRLTCITCHSYHAEFWDAEYSSKFLLRRPRGIKLCTTCHKKFKK
ncbi:MAG TPA: hypothetical protein ENK33_09665 [Desulfobacterales bacterium]|nr:hypothetical protein [Desulfobacterales bacterium]